MTDAEEATERIRELVSELNAAIILAARDHDVAVKIGVRSVRLDEGDGPVTRYPSLRADMSRKF